MFRYSILLTLALSTTALFTTPAQAQNAHDLVQTATEKLGGLNKLSALETMKWSGIGHQFDLVQSERPEGPWLTIYFQIQELRDLKADASRRQEDTRSVLSGNDWVTADYIYREGILYRSTSRGMFPMPPAYSSLIVYEQKLNPIRVLLEANRSENLVYEGESWLDDVRHLVLSYSTKTDSVVVFLNANTLLPTAVDTYRPAYFDIWGTAHHRTYFSVWFLEDNGIRYPRQIDEYLNGYPSRSTTINDLEFNVEVPADTIHVPVEIRALANNPSFDMRTLPYGQNRTGREPSTLPGGIMEVPGAWDVMFIPQPDGLVIIEAPISSEHSVQVLNDAAIRFPGLPVKAVITTSDAWPHFGGIREYVARGIPIYALERNQGILSRLFKASFSRRPDALELNRAQPDVFWVGEAGVELGEGENKMVLFQASGEGSERMLFIYFPTHRMLYASDMVQRSQDGSFFMPQYLTEVTDAIEREKFEVNNVIAMHVGLTSLEEIKSVIASTMEGIQK